MVVSATVRYATSVSHISLPQTSVSVDGWVENEKSKHYHNQTSSTSYDVCTPAFLIYAVVRTLRMCVKQQYSYFINPFNLFFIIVLPIVVIGLFLSPAGSACFSASTIRFLICSILLSSSASWSA